MKLTDRALSFDNSIIELPYSITFASRHPLLAFATRQYQYSTPYQPELQYIKPLVLTVPNGTNLAQGVNQNGIRNLTFIQTQQHGFRLQTRERSS